MMMMKDQIEQLEAEAAGKVIFNPPSHDDDEDSSEAVQ